MWREHYASLLSSVNNNLQEEPVKSFIKSRDTSCEVPVISVGEISNAISDLPSGKAVGADNLSCEHYKFSSNRLHVLLALLYSAFLIHGFLPDDFMKSIIVPLVKDKTGDLTSKDNYRPIAISTPASKILEIIILNRCRQYLDTEDFQFGFKQGHSTDLCIHILKEVINYYRTHNSSVFVCFLDATKAFDRVNHWTLFKKLIDRGIPRYVIRILLFWYRTQTFFVQWGGARSQLFNVKNGVRQGSVLSPLLFNVYMDELSIRLKSSNKGCNIGGQVINHLMYADDLSLVCPSIKGLRDLVSICESYGIEHDIVYHKVKSKCMYFIPRKSVLKLENLPLVKLGNNNLQVVHHFVYLGYDLNDNFLDDDAIKQQTKSFYVRANTILRKFSYCSAHVRMCLFRSFCTNMYCSSIWSSYTKKKMNSLRVAYNNAFRITMGYTRDCSASAMFVCNNIPTFEALRRKSMYNFYERVKNSANVLIITVFNSDALFYSQNYRMYRQLMYL